MIWDLQLDKNGNIAVVEEQRQPDPQSFGNVLHQLVNQHIDKQVVEDILQKTIDYYWEENCEDELPPNIEVVEATHDTITFLVHEDDPWSFSVPI